MFYDFDKAVTRDEAVAMLLEHWTFTPQKELVPLSECIGRITSEDIFSANVLPVFRVSAFDGYAVKSSAFSAGLPDTSAWKEGTDYVPADTGDDFPDEFDAIVAVEDVSFDEDGHLCLIPDELEPIVPGKNVRPSGSMLKKGELLVSANTKISAGIQAVLAMGGIYFVPVIKKPRVSFLPTGSELVPAGVTPQRGENIDANSLLMKAMLEEMGAEAVLFPITKDNKELLSARLDEALSFSDIVIINGGTSKGQEDFNSHLLQEKASFFRHGVKAVPGRPVGISVIGGIPALNIPGPVMACWLASDWLVRALVCHYLGIPVPQREKVRGRLTQDIKKGPKFEMLSRVIVSENASGITVSPIPRTSGTAASMCGANALLTLPVGCEGYKAGDEVEAELFYGKETIVK